EMPPIFRVPKRLHVVCSSNGLQCILFTARSGGDHTPSPQFPALVDRDRLQPAAEISPGSVVFEVWQLFHQQDQNILYQVSRIMITKTSPLRPAIQKRRIQRHEPLPRGLIIALANALQ